MERATVNTNTLTPVDEQWPEPSKRGSLRILLRHHELIQSLVSRDIRSRYKQSILGIAWALLQPLAMMIVYTVVFSMIATIDTGSIPYPLFSYVSVLPWMFFSQGVTASAECLVANFSLITKIYFPREAFPVSAILGKTVDLGLGVLVSVPLFIYYHVHLTWLILLVVPILLVQTCLMLGISLILSSTNVFYRDVRHVVPLLLQVWMYLSPVVYPMEKVPERYRLLYNLNPMASIIDSYHRVALQGQAPVWSYLGIGTLVSVITLLAGYRLFKRLEPSFAEIV